MGTWIKVIRYTSQHNCRESLPLTNSEQAGSVWLCDCGRAWEFGGLKETDSSLHTTEPIWSRKTSFDRE